MSLTREQKQDLLSKYFANEISGEGNNDIINEIFSEAKWPTRVEKNAAAKLSEKICEVIPGNELYDLIYSIYDNLNKTFDFDHSDRNQARICFGIESLIKTYHKKEAEQSKNLAYQDTRSYCFYLVTIPFARSYYNAKVHEYHKQQNFQSLFVDQKYLPKESEDGTRKMYGLHNKTIINREDGEKKPFKNILFNKKNQVRKYMTSSEQGFYGRYGINLLGTKEQIKHCAEKLILNQPKK